MREMRSYNQSIILLALIIQAATVGADFIPSDGYPATSDLIKLRGFNATDHYVTTTDGYVLNLVEMRNPLIPNGYSGSKDAILFIHGIANNANFFSINSVGIKPKNYADFNVNSIDEKEFNLESDPAGKSLPFLASIFGHSVWLLNRRGNSQSQGCVDPNKQPFSNPIKNIIETGAGGILPSVGREKRHASVGTNLIMKFLKGLVGVKNEDSKQMQSAFNPRYWNFSLDEEAKYDIPEVISYVLRQTNKEKLALVGHSVGSALVLMSLSIYPELANNISKAILYGPALYPTSARDFLASSAARWPLDSYIGPILPKSVLITLLNFIEGACSNNITQPTACIPFMDTIFGHGGTQLNLSLKFFRITTDLDSSHSVSSLAQAATKGKMHFFDYMNSQRNLIAYNQTSPPIYDVSRIKLRTISLWSGATDGLVPYRTALEIGADMSVPVEQVYLNESNLLFNHISYSIHNDLPRLVTIPALRRIES